jgi:hypothetical protein
MVSLASGQAQDSFLPRGGDRYRLSCRGRYQTDRQPAPVDGTVRCIRVYSQGHSQAPVNCGSCLFRLLKVRPVRNRSLRKGKGQLSAP